MATIVLDYIAGSNWATLDSRSGITGAVWTRHTAASGSNGRMYIYGSRVHPGSAASDGASYYNLYYASGVPSSADYAVECDFYMIDSQPDVNIGPTIRTSTSADTYYTTFYNAGQLLLVKRIAGVNTTLGTWTSALSYGGTTYRIRLEAVGDQITVDVDGVERIAATDTSITAAGRAGLRAAGVVNQDEGIHIDDFYAEDATAAAAARSYAVGLLGL